MSFYVTLPSDSSMHFFPENKISHFKTQLPSPVCLNGEWEVGLSEIIYPHSWLNVNETNNYFLYKAGDGNISSTVKRTIDVGCYETMLDIISAVQLALPKNPNRFTIIYNKATKRVKINAVQGSSLHLENLGELLGFKRNAIIIGTQTVIQDGQWKQFHPLSNVFDNAPVEFHISGSAEDYIDLSQTQLYVKAKIVKVDNTPITKDDTIGPVNLFLHSLFSQVDVSLNDRVVSNSSNTYPYRSYIETLLNHGYDSKTSQLTAELFYKDSDDGLKKRTEFFKESATVDMIGCIHSDLFHQDRLLLNLVDLKIKLIRSKPEFCLQGSEGFKVVLIMFFIHTKSSCERKLEKEAGKRKRVDLSVSSRKKKTQLSTSAENSTADPENIFLPPKENESAFQKAYKTFNLPNNDSSLGIKEFLLLRKRRDNLYFSQ
ncbi:uncharacterized protein TNCV_4594231 [Trichonephila clavipes]|uniref:Uncharacterized protein n=1 Tax=Trichonephila clavipes TaxID=2585209 RepID=A0A8X6WGF9_TRICX|nr:uncharacterized protein TNCV_4594231 [Trichonephila clavipes]